MSKGSSTQYWTQNITQRIGRGVMIFGCAFVLSTSLSAPSHAQAIDPSNWPANMENWVNALTGSFPDQAIIDNDLAAQDVIGPIPPAYFNFFGSPTFAGLTGSLPAEFSDPVLMASALGGNEADLQILQAALIAVPPTAPDGPIPPGPPNTAIGNYMAYEVAAGSGDAALITLKLAVQGDANANTVLGALLGPTAPTYISFLSSTLGCGDTATDPDALAAVEQVFDDAIAGDATALSLIQDALYQAYVGGNNGPYITDDGTVIYPPYSFGQSWVADIIGTYDPALNQAPLEAPCLTAGNDVPPDDGIEIDPDDLPPGTDPDNLDPDVGDYPPVPEFQTPETRDGAWWSEGDEYFGLEDNPPTPEDNDDCGDEDAPLTDDFAEDPCTWTRDNQSLEYAQDHQAGWNFVTYMWDWWYDAMLPAFHDMIAQINAMYVVQTMHLGTFIDAQNTNKATSLMQQGELNQKKRMVPSEQTCVAATLSLGGSQGKKTQFANALKTAQTNETLQRTGNAPGSGSERGVAQDLSTRWDRYCEYFFDPESNAGQHDCPSAAPGEIMDADVKVEDFLFRDTIDFSQEEERVAAQALLANLITPHVKDPHLTFDDPQDQEAILKDQHLQAVRKFATSVVASMFSRRAAILETDSDVAQLIRDIRTKSGVPNEEISNTPSYNEVMQAMTKERFLTPTYYVQMLKNDGEMKQEQNSVNSYISMQLQDIYTLQEQINSLLAIKGAMELKESPSPDFLNALPK